MSSRSSQPPTPPGARVPPDVMQRVQGEFREMPGLRLTEPQARRLWNLDKQSCEVLLGALVEDKFLYKTRDGAFVRTDTTTPVRAVPRPPSKTTAA